MAFWPIYMAACAFLMIFRRGGYAPFFMLAGLVGVRLTSSLGPDWHVVGSFTVWAAVVVALYLTRHGLVCLLIAISTLTYGLAGFGFGIEKFGLMPVLSDLFLIAGLIACALDGGGGYQRGTITRLHRGLAGDDKGLAFGLARNPADNSAGHGEIQ